MNRSSGEQSSQLHRANDLDLFKRWLCGGVQDLGEAAVMELRLDWIDPFITKVEADRVSTNTNDYQFHPLLPTQTQIKCRASLSKLKLRALRFIYTFN